jgi:hypothetical protein
VEEGQQELADDLVTEAAQAAQTAQYEGALQRIERLRRWMKLLTCR